MLERNSTTSIHPTAIVEKGAEIGAGVVIGPFCTVGAGVRIGDGTVLHSHVAVSNRTEIGADCQVFPFSSLGSPPQDYKYQGGETRLIIGARNIIREHVTMNGGASADDPVTVVGSDGMFMVGAHIAHDCRVGDHVVFANNATIGGHCTIGDYVYLGGLCAVHQHCRIGRCAIIGGITPVVEDVIPFGMVASERGDLGGLNIIGLKRRDFSRDTIHRMRNAYAELFEGAEGTFSERVDEIARTYADAPVVLEIVEFIRADAKRPLCQPRPKRAG